MSDSDRFSRTLTAADANNIVLLVDFNTILAPYEQLKIDNIVSHTIAVEDLHAKVGLFSLLEASWPDTNQVLSTQAQQNAAEAKILKEGQKIYLELYTARGNGPWERQGEEILQNKNGLEQPWSLMLLLGTNLTALFGESIKIGVKIASKAQGVGGLKGSDYVTVLGTWRKNTKIEPKKKDDGIEALKAEVEVLRLAIYGRLSDVPANTLLGRGDLPGVVSAIPASNFVTPAQLQIEIEQAIFDLAGAAPAALNTLAELAAVFGNDPNFAATITALIATKAVLNLSLQLTNRSNATGIFDANAWVLTFFAGLKWLDGGVTNLNLPPGLNTGMIIQFDPLHIYSVAKKYLVQIFFSGTRLFFRIQVNEVWGQWREIATSVAV